MFWSVEKVCFCRTWRGEGLWAILRTDSSTEGHCSPPTHTRYRYRRHSGSERGADVQTLRLHASLKTSRMSAGLYFHKPLFLFFVSSQRVCIKWQQIIWASTFFHRRYHDTACHWKCRQAIFSRFYPSLLPLMNHLAHSHSFMYEQGVFDPPEAGTHVCPWAHHLFPCSTQNHFNWYVEEAILNIWM